jgi:uncharacterized membrane protein
MFAEIQGLPLHPLVVHAVVVLVPLSALGAVLVAARPRWARPYGPLVAFGAVAAAGAAWVAQQAGNALEAELGYTGDALERIETHGRWGLYVVNLGAGFAVLAVVSTVLAFRLGPDNRWQRVAAWLTAALGVGATVFAVLAGDTGARSVWGSVLGDG